MSSLSSWLGDDFSSKPRPSNQNVYVRFHGPGTLKQTLDMEQPGSGQRIPMFDIKSDKSSKPNLTVTRLMPNGNRFEFATANLPSLSGSIPVMVHNQEYKLKYDENLSGSRRFSAYGKELKWKVKDSLTGYELYDQDRNRLAYYKMCDSMGGGEKTLEIYVQVDDYFVDMIVATALAVMKKESKDEKTAFKIIKHAIM